MRKSRAREDRKLLSSYERVKSVNGGNSRLDKLGRIVTCRGVDRRSVDVERLLGDKLCTTVDRLAHSVEYSSEHIGRNGKLNAVSRKSNLTVREIKTCARFKELNQHVSAVDLKHSATAHVAVRQLYLAKLVVLYALDLLYKHQRSCDLFYCSVFSDHFRCVLP